MGIVRCVDSMHWDYEFELTGNREKREREKWTNNWQEKEGDRKSQSGVISFVIYVGTGLMYHS